MVDPDIALVDPEVDDEIPVFNGGAPTQPTSLDNITDLGSIGVSDSIKQQQQYPTEPLPLNLTTTSGISVDPETDLTVSPEEDEKSPLEMVSDSKGLSRVGFGPDKKPALDVQNVDSFLRWKTQLLFDTAKEKSDYLKQELGDSYLIAQHPTRPTDVILKKKGSRYWGVIDPGDNDSMLKEAAENVDNIAMALAMPTGVVAGALTQGGLEGLRQVAKKTLSPSADVNYGKIAVGAAAGALGAGVQSVLGLGAKTATNAVGSAINAGTKVAGQAEKAGLLNKVKSIANFSEQPQFILQELGGSKKDFLDYGKKSLEENVAWLQQNAGDKFKEVYNSAWRLKGKKEALETWGKELGAQLGEVYGNPANTLKARDIIDDKAAGLLDEAITTRQVQQGLKKVAIDETTTRKAQAIQRRLLTDVGNVTLGPDSPYVKAYRAKKLLSLPEIQSIGITNEDAAMAFILRDQDMTLADALAVRSGLDDALSYGKAKGQIGSVDTLQKHAADSVRNAIQKKIGEISPDLAITSDTFHKLEPLIKVASNAVAGSKTEAISFTKLIPGAINGMKRGGLLLAGKLANRPEVRTALRGLVDLKLPTAAGEVPLKASQMKELVKRGLRGGSFLEAKNVMGKNLLPRDADAYFDNPDLINAFTQQVADPELTDVLVRQYERGDRESFANTMSNAASTNEDLFDAAPYKSLVTQGGKQVIMDKYDREQYRQWVDKNVSDPAEKYEIYQNLNFKNEMTKSPFEASKQKMQFGAPSELTKSASAVSRVASELRKTETVKLDDGTERVDHDY
jgi:K+-transporting ATPase c subunit